MAHATRFFYLLWPLLSVASLLQAQCPNPPVANAGPDQVLTCASISVVLQGQANTTGVTYAWSGPQAFASTAQNPSAIVPGTYTLTVRDVNGCTGTDEVLVVQDIMAPVVSVQRATLTCSAPVATLNAIVTNVSGQATYWWTGPANYSSVLLNPQVNTPGVYTLVVTNPVNGCTASVSVTVLQDITPPDASIIALPGSGCLRPLRANSVTPNAFYQWSGPNGFASNQPIIQPLTAGTYSLRVLSPANGCTATTQAVAGLPPSVQFPGNRIICSGSPLNVAFQGTQGAAFQWTSSNPALSLPQAGSGNIQQLVFSNSGVEDSTVIIVTPLYPGCSGASQTFTVKVRPVPRPEISSGSAVCAGESITLTASGGSSYVWSNGTTTATTTVMPQIPTAYWVTVTGANGCTAVRDRVVGVGLDLNGTGAPACQPTFANASIDLTVRNGTGPFTYQWSNGAGTEDLSNLVAGSYTVTVQDANGCRGILRMKVDTIPGLTRTNFISCSLRDQDTIFIPRDGHPYQLDWSHLPGADDPPYLGKVPSGTYTLLITAQNGCSARRTVTVIAGNAPGVQATATDVSCFGGKNGSVTSSVAGGTPPYTYQWSSGSGLSVSINGLSTGIYTVTVTDSNGCTGTASASVQQPPPLNITIAQRVCTTGSPGLTVSASGGTPPYAYVWPTGVTTAEACFTAGGTYTVTVTDSNGCTGTASGVVASAGPLTLQVSAIPVSCFGGNNGYIIPTAAGGTPPYVYGSSVGGLTNLPAGTYRVIVTDGVGTTAVADATIVQPAQLIAIATVTPPLCRGGNNGTIAVSVSGGTHPYMYLWNNGVDGLNLISAAEGTYTVTVIDNKGCTSILSETVVTQSKLTANANVTYTSCTAAAIVVNAANGLAPYIYKWNDGTTTQSRPDLPVGYYQITVTDGYGCSEIVVDSVSRLPGLHFAGSNLCPPNASVRAGVAVGGQPYQFDWAHLPGTNDPQTLTNVAPGTYTVTAIAANGCSETKTIEVPAGTPLQVSLNSVPPACFGTNNGRITSSVSGGTQPYRYLWSNNATSANISGLTAGTYIVTVTDAKGCSEIRSVLLSNPARLISTPNIQNATCGLNNGRISLAVSGGTPPYGYIWSNGATTAVITNLSAGNYTVSVTDANGCLVMQVLPVTGSFVPVINFNIPPIFCGATTASVTATISAGLPPFVFLWSNGNTTSSLNNVPLGTYTVTVTNGSGCTASKTAVLLPQIPLLVNALSCDSLTTLSVTDGVPPFTFRWDNGATGPTQSLPPGMYRVTVTGSNGCSKVQDIWVSPNPSPCTYIEGAVRTDANNNCRADSGEAGLSGRMIRAENTTTGTAYLAQTALDGSYILRVVPGNYQVRMVTPVAANQWICRNDTFVQLPVQGDRASVQYAIRNIPSCPKMTVDINTGFLRRCFSGNYYFVRCCNTGTAAATDAYVDVRLDPFLIYENANRPGIAIGDNTYRFLLGTLQPGQCVSFNIIVKVSCDAAIGQAHCTEAHVYPDTSCTPVSPQWKGGLVAVAARCTSDSLRFILKNIGKGGLSQNLEYIVIEDGIMARSGQTLPLPPGDSMLVVLPANGRTWRLETRQEPFAPGAARPALSIEGCRRSGPFTTGFVTQFPIPVNGPWQDIDCTINRGAYDPNDKAGTPVGFGTRRYVEPETDIHYKIRFQNTGTDTAFNVVIRDTLSKWLDPESVVAGVSSHPYTFELTGRGVLVFAFPNIMLPDSNINEPLSNGYVEYVVRPRATVPLETDIFNSAAIYFDFNDPIFTNTTVHRVGRNFVTVGLWEPRRPEYTVRVVPQPMSEGVQIWVDGAPTTGNYELQFFDARGVLVRSLSHTAPRFEVQRDDLAEGLYLFRVLRDGVLTGSGKVIVTP